MYKTASDESCTFQDSSEALSIDNTMNPSNTSSTFTSRNSYMTIGVVVMKGISDIDADIQNSLLSLKNQSSTGRFELWILDENLSVEMKKWCKENNVNISSRSGLNLYNRKSWPRKKGALEGGLSYFVDKYSSKYEYICIINGAYKANQDLLSKILSKFSNENNLQIYSVGSEDRKTYQVIPTIVFKKLNIINYSNVTIKQSAFDKINNFSQGNLFLMNSFTNPKEDSDFVTESSQEVLLTKIRSTPFSKSSFSEVFSLYYELIRNLLGFTFKNVFSFGGLSLISTLFASTFDILRFFVIYSTPFLLVLFNIQDSRFILILFGLILICDMILNFFQNGLNIRRYPEEDLSILTLPVQIYAIFISVIDYIFRRPFRTLRESRIRPFTIMFHIIYLIALAYITYRHITSVALIQITIAIFFTFILKIIFLKKKSVIYFLIVSGVLLSTFFYSTLFQSNEKVSAEDSWVNRVNNERVGIQPIRESNLLNTAAKWKVYSMFDTNSHEHSIPLTYYLDTVGYFYINSKEILYEGVGTLDKIFTYWDSKPEYHDAIIDPKYCEGGFWTETRMVDGQLLNRTTMYLVSKYVGCNPSTTTTYSSYSTYTTISSSKTSTFSASSSSKTSVSSSQQTSFTTSNITSTPASTSSISTPTSISSTTTSTATKSNSTISSKESSKTKASSTVPTSESSSSFSNESSISTSEETTSSSTASSIESSTTTEIVSSTNTSKTISTNTPTQTQTQSQNGTNLKWNDILSLTLIFAIIVLGRFYYDVFYYFEKS